MEGTLSKEPARQICPPSELSTEAWHPLQGASPSVLPTQARHPPKELDLAAQCKYASRHVCVSNGSHSSHAQPHCLLSSQS